MNADRFDVIRNAVLAEMGGADRLSQHQLQSATAYAQLCVRRESLDASALTGDPVVLRDYLALIETMNGLATSLGLARPVVVAPPLAEISDIDVGRRVALLLARVAAADGVPLMPEAVPPQPAAGPVSGDMLADLTRPLPSASPSRPSPERADPWDVPTKPALRPPHAAARAMYGQGRRYDA